MSEKEYTPKNILSLIAVGAIMIVGISLVTGCGEASVEERFVDYVNDIGTPNGAKNIEVID